MTIALKDKIVEVCDKKISQKGTTVGISFYAFLRIKMTIQNY